MNAELTLRAGHRVIPSRADRAGLRTLPFAFLITNTR